MTKRSQPNKECGQEHSKQREQLAQRCNKNGLFRNSKTVSVANMSSRERGMGEDSGQEADDAGLRRP